MRLREIQNYLRRQHGDFAKRQQAVILLTKAASEIEYLQAIANAVANLDGQELHRSGLGSKQMVVRKSLYDAVCVAWHDWKAAEPKDSDAQE